MSVKKAVLLFPFILVAGFSAWASFYISDGISAGFDIVRVSDSSYLQLNRTLFFKTGAEFSDGTALYAYSGLSLADGKHSSDFFKTFGNINFLRLGVGVCPVWKRLNPIFGAGLDFLFASSGLRSIYSLVYIQVGFSPLLVESSKVKLNLESELSASFSVGIERFAFSLGINAKYGGGK